MDLVTVKDWGKEIFPEGVGVKWKKKGQGGGGRGRKKCYIINIQRSLVVYHKYPSRLVGYSMVYHERALYNYNWYEVLKQKGTLFRFILV